MKLNQRINGATEKRQEKLTRNILKLHEWMDRVIERNDIK
jgi:hypothetical protein